MTLDSPIQYVPKIGPVMAGKLDKLNIKTVEDLLNHLPSHYNDFSNITTIEKIQAGEFVTVKGKLTEIKNQYTHGGFVLQKGTIDDETGTIDLMWFNQPFLIKGFTKGEIYVFQGKVDLNGKKLVIKSPKTGNGLDSVYPETLGVTSKWLRARIDYLLKNLTIVDYLPCDLMELGDAWHKIHFPNNLNEAEEARKRLIFNEVLISQLISKKRKEQWQETKLAHEFKIIEYHETLDKFVKNLPFVLTKSQKDVINDIYQDLAKNKPMNRLLQGDVGSGKTVVAALAMLATQLNGFKAVLMAPTEILANQHYQTLQKMGLKVGIVTGSTKNYKDFDILIGTHALLNIQIEGLGLVVIDEQHRFGVSQRAKLLAMSEGHTPHTLTMTATPIPRTIALTMFGDLDISHLNELPTGRLPVKTWVVPETKREAAYAW
ncbi:MAG: DEAD/DEAH box helicase, partial [bacterium]|nr:DEAD/DEAH box helicase [bacterium]